MRDATWRGIRRGILLAWSTGGPVAFVAMLVTGHAWAAALFGVGCGVAAVWWVREWRERRQGDGTT